MDMAVPQSALSHTVRGLQARLPRKLLNRSTRSVSPTEAGERLCQTLARRLADIKAALQALGELRGRPAGTVRITVSQHAAQTLVWSRLLAWLPQDMAQPHIDSGALVLLLKEWAAVYPGYHLYYASRNASAAVQLVAQALRLPGQEGGVQAGHALP